MIKLFLISVLVSVSAFATPCFDKHDLNSDGIITIEEFRATQISIEQCLDTVRLRKHKFHRLDRNADQKLSIFEFQKCPPNHHHCIEKNRMILFGYMSGKDSYISQEEYTACPMIAVELLFKLYDLNGNGEITEKEKDDSNNGTM